MSRSSNKQAVATLKSHLGRDAQGLRLLDTVADELRELHKQRRAADEQAATAATAAAEKHKLYDSATTKIQQLEAELLRLQSQCRQHERTIVTQQQEITTLQVTIEQLQPAVTSDDLVPGTPHKDEPFPVALLRENALANTFNLLRKEIRICPEPISRNEVCLAFRLEDIISGYSPADMMTLGRFVTCSAMMNFPCTVAATTTFHAAGLKAQEQYLAKFVHWFRRNIRRSRLEKIVYGPE